MTTVALEEIPPELVLNWDQTGLKIVPSSSWTMERCGVKRVDMLGINDKRQITAVFCGSLTGDFLPVQLIYAGKTPRCHPKFNFPPGWDITHAPKHWSNEDTMLQYISNIVVPYVESMREKFDEDPAALIVMDNFKGQVTPKVNQLLEEHRIHVCLLPPNTTDRLQPLDISVNKPAKEFLRRKFQEWYFEKIMEQIDGDRDIDGVEISPVNLGLPVLKELGAQWLVQMAEYISDNPQMIVNGFVRAGISAALDGVSETDNSNTTTLDSDSESDYYSSEEEEIL